jgi:hypothetical protein
LIEKHYRYPKFLLFYLSAFVSSARSVTLHLQKQLTSISPAHRATYEKTVTECLSDEFSKYFVGLRNRSLHEMYIPLLFHLVEPGKESGKDYSISRASSQPSSPSHKHFAWLQAVLDTANQANLPNDVQWVLSDFPAKKYHLLYACKEYLERLDKFIITLRERIFKLHKPESDQR